MGLQSSATSNSDVRAKVQFNRFLIFQISFPLMGGFLYGYNTGVISGALLFLNSEFNLSVIYQEILVTITIIGATICAIIGGVLSEKIGRISTIKLSSILMLCGAILMGMAPDASVVVVGRAIVGLGIGLSSTACPIYIAEVAPHEIRGRLIVLYQIMIAGGQFIAAVINALFYYTQPKDVWRYMLGFAAIPSLIQDFGLIFIPESHRWLLSKDKLSKAKEIIKKERRIEVDSIDDYVDEIILSNEKLEASKKIRNLEHRNIMYQIFHDRNARRSLIIGCGIQTIGQLVGINGVIYYLSSIINMAGIVDPQKVLWYTALVMFFCFAPVIIGFFLIDKIGRRHVSLISLAGILIGSMILAIGFQVIYFTSTKVTDRIPIINQLNDSRCYNRVNCEDCVTIHTCGFCLAKNSTASYCLSKKSLNFSIDGECSELNKRNSSAQFFTIQCHATYAWIIITGMIVYLLSFSIGMGPVPWVVTAEIYPLWCRGINMAISNTFILTFNVLISMTFLSLTNWITRFGAFYLFAAISLCSIGFVYKWLPETSNVTLEEMADIIEEY